MRLLRRQQEEQCHKMAQRRKRKDKSAKGQMCTS